jgi:ketosteroid isomerase-like protein
MSKHPHFVALEKLYSEFLKGLEGCSEQVTFQVPGRSKLAGKYTRATFVPEFVTRIRELSGGTFKLSVHDILASDLHATVLASYQLVRDGKPVELRTVHVWRFENGKPLAGYEYPRDLYQYDLIWS